jgi:hypothetical protein
MTEAALQRLDQELGGACAGPPIDGLYTLRQHQASEIYLHVVLLR